MAKKNGHADSMYKQDRNGDAYDVDSLITRFKHNYDSCVAGNDADGAFMAAISVAIKYSEKEDYEMVRSYCRLGIPWAKKSTIKDAVAWCYNNIADAYVMDGEYTKGLENLYTALDELNKRTSEVTHTTANIYNNFGAVYMRLNQPEKAMEFYRRAERACISGKLYFQLGNTYTDVGEHYLAIKQYDSAIRYFNKLMEIGRQIDKADLQGIAYTDLGKVYIELHQYAIAIEYLQHAITMARNRYGYIISNASFALIDAWCATGKYKEALAMASQLAEQNSGSRTGANYINAYQKQAMVYRMMGNSKKAMECMDTVLILKDQVTAKEKQKAISHAEAVVKVAENDKKIAEDQLLIARQQEKISRKNLMIGGVGAGVVIFALTSLLLYLNSRNKQRIYTQQLKALEDEKMINTLKGMVQGADNERARIARDLHDGIGGMLSVAMMHVRGIKKEKPDVALSDSYSEAIKLLNKTGDEIRKTAHNLMPEVLMKQNLNDAVADHCSLLRSGGLDVDFQSYGDMDVLPQDAKLNIYRIIQELLENVVKHAQADHVIVQLQLQDEQLTLTVEDNGVGADMTDVSRGLGLHNIDVRVKSMSGKVEIDTAPGSGFSVYIELNMNTIADIKPLS